MIFHGFGLSLHRLQKNGKMGDIGNRDDIELLVRTFYKRVRKDDLLGPIFEPMIKDWEAHFAHLTNFWESNLFFKKTYGGDPLQKHIDVDIYHHDSINELHFGVWINLWYKTVDELFEGEVAQIAKNRARNMGTFIHLKIFEARQSRRTK
jgi:hemoglobin